MIKQKKQRPGAWATGPDPLKHDMYMPFLRARAQAKFRNESWDLTFDDFYSIWANEWTNKGQKGYQLCLTREDIDAAWTKSNCFLITRADLQRKLDEYRVAHNIRRATRGPDKTPRKQKVKK